MKSTLQDFSQHLEDTVFFLELQSANPFRIRALKNAVGILDELEDEDFLKRVKESKLSELKGIGKGIASMAEQYVEKQISDEYETAREDMPLSLLELRDIRGLGAKKIKQLFEDLKISSLGELEYACIENRLVSLNGFGEKTQSKLLHEIEQIKSRRGKLLLPDALAKAAELEGKFKAKKMRFSFVGEVERKSEIVECLEMLLLAEDDGVEDKFVRSMQKLWEEDRLKKKSEFFKSTHFKNKDGLQIRFIFVDSETELWVAKVYLTSTGAHWTSLVAAAKEKGFDLEPRSVSKDQNLVEINSEEEVYQLLDLAFHPAECREFAAEKKKVDWVSASDLTGVFHAHTTYSDGKNSLEEMQKAAADRGWSYLGISEHSESSFYANGLSEEDLQKQWAEIDKLNKKNPACRILKGIESDILKDGSLDYPKKLLKNFEFVIASIHQRYGMKEMTDRLLKAIENPFTHMIGHISGRLLLARSAYRFDCQKIVKKAIAENVVIELNANPHRLDMDWRELQEACKAGLIISINPDAHSIDGFDDTQYGIWMARKAGVKPEQVLNTWPLDRVESFFDQRAKSAA